MAAAVGTEVGLQLSPSTPQAIHELMNYRPFSCVKSFSHSCSIARDTYKHENRAIGVFTSGDDAPGLQLK